MAESISFSNGSFTTGLLDLPGADVEVREDPGGEGFILATENRSTIVNLGIQGDENGQILNFTSDTPTTVRGLTANMGGGADVLIIGGKVKGDSEIKLQAGRDTFESSNIVRDSSIATNAGKDRAVLTSPADFVAVDSSFDMGKGADTLVFGGSVKNVEVSLGSGADSVELQGNIRDSNLNLGGVGSTPDGQSDIIRIAGDATIKGLVITGADENDKLFIGSSEYNYDSARNLWVNASNSRDTRDFS